MLESRTSLSEHFNLKEVNTSKCKRETVKRKKKPR